VDAEEEFARESVDKGVSCLKESADDLLTAPLAGVGLEVDVDVDVDVDVADADVDAVADFLSAEWCDGVSVGGTAVGGPGHESSPFLGSARKTSMGVTWILTPINIRPP